MDENFTLWLEFENWKGEPTDDPEDDFFNMKIEFNNGRKYALNVWTYKFFARAVEECKAEGENLNGSYLLPPDLFVRRLDRKLIENAVSDMIANKTLLPSWKMRDEEK